MCSVEPPLTGVTALVGTPGFAGVPRPGFADTPPHGAIFCGSPRLFWAMVVAGSISTKWASAAVESVAIAPVSNRIFNRTVVSSRRSDACAWCSDSQLARHLDHRPPEPETIE